MNSNHSTYTAPLLRRLCRSALYAFILTLTGGLTACHQSIAPTEEELAGSCEQAVRITARVSPFGGAPVGTRADVPGTVDNEQTGSWQPLEKDIAVKGESRISRLYVFVTKRGSDKIEKTLYYYAADYNGEGGEEVEDGKLKDTEIPALQLTTNESGEVTMDMTLLPGDYSFTLVANSYQLAKTIKDEQPLNLSDLKNIFVKDGIGFASIAKDEGFTDFDYDFSIIGYGDLTVPATTDPDGRVELRPEIHMERHYARVDVSLTTATDNQLKDYLLEDGNGDRFDPSQYRLTQFLFLITLDGDTNKGKPYPVTLLPVEGEYTALPEGAPRYPLESYKAPVIGNGEGLSGRQNNRQFLYFDLVFSDSSSGSDLWGNYINNGKTGGLRRLWKQPLVFSRGSYKTPNEPGPGYIYLPSVYFGDKTDKDKDKDRVVRLQLKFTKLDDSETLVYRIPIHNEEDASDYYSIRRNTIYDIDLTFYGNKLEVQQSGVLVYPWKRVDQTLEINPDDEGVDPLWKQDKP